MQRAKANEKERLLATEVEMMIPKEQESKEVWERGGGGSVDVTGENWKRSWQTALFDKLIS